MDDGKIKLTNDAFSEEVINEKERQVGKSIYKTNLKFKLDKEYGVDQTIELIKESREKNLEEQKNLKKINRILLVLVIVIVLAILAYIYFIK